MADEKKIKIPDIGGAAGVDVIEILVKVGDEIGKDTPLITLESDKASMEIPSPESGTVQSIEVKVGDKVSEGDVILMLAPSQSNTQQESDFKSQENSESKSEKKTTNDKKNSDKKTRKETTEKEIKIPDIGGAHGVDVIEILVKEGDKINKDTPLITLESDKASMEIPSPCEGTVQTVKVKLGDKVSEGDVILTLMQEGETSRLESKHEPTSSSVENKKEKPQETSQPVVEISGKLPAKSSISNAPVIEKNANTVVFAGPAVRRLARELGVNLAEIQGSGRKLRISKEDVQQFVKAKLQEKTVASGLALSPAPAIDFSQFGHIEVKPLNKIKRLTGINVHRSWVTIPHVTQFDEADITELEAFRQLEAEGAKKSGYKLTLLAFVCKVVSKALAKFPQFNASLDVSGENLIYKHYFNIGVAVETPNGLVVPVIKDVDQLSVGDIAQEMARLSSKAREKGLMPADMNGGCFTISSLGGIGGTAFTPIVNSPEVAILGLSRSMIKPVYLDGEFKPRLMLPLSLSYDHRVIDGAEAARFTGFLSDSLSDIRKILL
ncbi:dihydrolipoyllysine-residue acetyltransferase [Legionella nagasakiensis]|uniref:dihydrolipoyllysine-residue acetyltransferase n=1 Tax=Legionella nagasakiensis TaxID=535290 RepID=UPI0010552DFC|nr:dihydrolipoyllysine-residue acetyltransferase [Legionella nagasakiensis]